MINLKDFILSKKIYTGYQSEVFRGFNKNNGKSVVIKVLKLEKENEPQIARFKREYDLLKSLKEDGTVAVFDFLKEDNEFAIIMEDFAQQSLKDYLAVNTPLSIDNFLRLALKITDALEAIHRHSIIHKDLNPSNILYSREKNTVKIIDFGIASTLTREESEIKNFSTLEGSLPYISPEQTGRMNRGIDYRTDYYSLGVIFYEMATGVLPFMAEDVMELIHAHIAKSPIAPHEQRSEIPVVISKIILKLMAKAAEERYQSTYGLKTDLEQCLVAWEKERKIKEFSLGAEDVSINFHVSEKLYGRKEEQNLLVDTFQRVSSTGFTELMLVTGYAGVGKSRLIHEIRRINAIKNGYFVTGKFDQFKRNVPYFAFIQALQELINQISIESTKQIERWRTRLNDALGVNGQVILEVFPELEAIIGPQGTVQPLGLNETQNRFNLVLQNLINALATKEQPLVIFLDDLQWADNPSLTLLETLLSSLDTRYIFLLGAYRENEIDATHPLRLMQQNLIKKHVTFAEMILNPLQINHVQELLSDTLHQTIDDIKPLAKICFEKTHGNPFFLLQFLQSLYRDKLIEFNVKQGMWLYHIDKIKKKDYTDNVVDFMANRVRELSTTTQKYIQLAACLGHRFDLKTLAIISEATPTEINTALWQALEEGLISPEDSSYQLVNEQYNTQVYYSFLHDRIQQAAYSLIADKDKSKIQLAIGQLLLKNSSKEMLAENLLEIVDHINQGLSLISNREEKLKIAELNLQAGEKAKASNAYKTALNYLKTGISLLDDNKWSTHYELTLGLYTAAFEATYLAGEFSEMETYSEILFLQARSVADKIKVYEVKLNYLSAQNRFTEAIQLGRKALALYNISFPEDPKKYQAIIALLRIKWLLRNKSLEQLANLPEMTDPNWQDAMRILASVGTVAYLGHPYLAVFVILELIKLTLKYGMAPQSANGFIGYSTMLCTILKNADLGYQFGKLAIRIVDEHQFERQKPQVYMAFCMVISIWKVALDDIMPTLVNTFHQGIEVGDLENSGFKAAGYVAFLFSSGKNLKLVTDASQKYGQYLLKFGQITSYKYLFFYWYAGLRLSGATDETIKSLGADYDEKEMIAEAVKTRDASALAEIYFVKIICSYFDEDFTTALEAALACDPYLEGPAETQIIAPLIYLYSSLTFLACYPQAPKDLQKKYLSYVKRYLAKLKFRSKQAPMNYLHTYYLVLGAYYTALGKLDKSIKYFDLCILDANKNGYVNEEAIANELAAKVFLSQGNEKIAKAYLSEGHSQYLQWGALSKAKQLQEKYAHLILREEKSEGIRQVINHIGKSNQVEKANQTLDLATIIKSAQTISKEIILTNLLKRMMHIVIENAGAQKGYLLLEKEEDGQWNIEAEVTIDGAETVLQSVSPKEYLPNSVINYVMRTKKTLVIDDAMHDLTFSKDPYIRSNESKSILAMPLLKQGVLIGMLYLENKLSVNVFTQERLDLLNLLSGQIVISIDNARLYTDTINLNKNLTDLNKSLVDLNKSYARFVPQEFLNLLSKTSILDVIEGDQIQKDMTILFSDIRNFTSLSETMSPAENFAFINEFLYYIEPQISLNHGFVDKYFGDGIMSLFPTSADDALKAAIGILYALRKFNQVRKNQHKQTINIGIGLNSGKLMLGTVGDDRRMDVTVISDAVNLASRIEHITKVYHTSLLITEEVYIRLKNPALYSIRKIGSLAIKGKSKPIIVYEVFDADIPETKTLKNQSIPLFERAVTLYQTKNYSAAQSLFHEIIHQNKNDYVAKQYLKRCGTSISSWKNHHK